MALPADFILADLRDKFSDEPATQKYARIYDGQDFSHLFAVIHKLLNKHFGAINDRAQANYYYWAQDSRDFIDLIEEIEKILHGFKLAGVGIEIDQRYYDAIEQCRTWLKSSNGSVLPDDFSRIELIEYESIFSEPLNTIRLKKNSTIRELKMIGNGSYANVYSYMDPDYGIKFAIKRVKRGVSDRDLMRFQNEFKIMQNINFPYVVEVYKYDEDRNEYSMEFCNATLRSYIRARNNNLHFASRKRIALQFLYGINYIHTKKYLHRDISLQNILLKIYDDNVAIVKLSDFGLAKDGAAQFTRTHTEMRGTIRDPLLSNFRDYDVCNEVYSVGWILSYIFTGQESLAVKEGDVGSIVSKCTSNTLDERYPDILSIISDVEQLKVSAPEASA